MSFKWTQYHNWEDFEKDTLQDLLHDKFQNSIMLRAIKRHKTQALNDSIRLVSVKENERNVLIGFQTLPYQMLFYFTRGIINQDALSFYIDKIIDMKWDIHQIQGDITGSKLFAQTYSKKANKVYRLKETLIIYRLDELKQSLIAPEGKFRQATQEDMDFLPQWSVDFYTECRLDQQGRCIEFQKNKLATLLQNHYIWEVSNIPTSSACMFEVSEDTGNVSFVYTPPNHRKQGYAHANVWNICNKYCEKYKNIMLYADANYPTSNKIYQDIGFKKLFENSQYTFTNPEIE